MKKKTSLAIGKCQENEVKGEKVNSNKGEITRARASKIVLYNYKKTIFQQTINWLTDLIYNNLLCKLVY